MSTALEYTAPLVEKLGKGSLNIQALKDHALELWKKDQGSAKELGEALIAVRDVLRSNRGGFARWYRQQGLNENRVHYCIRLAEGKVKKARAATKKDQSKTDTSATIPAFCTPKMWSQVESHARARGTSPEELVKQIVRAWLKDNHLQPAQ